MIVEKQNVLMSLLRQAGVVRGKTRLQKLVFLIQEEQKIPLNYKFEPYHWGPLSFELQNDIDALVSQGIIIEYILEFRDLGGGAGKRHDYQLSEWGKAYFDKIVQPTLPKNIDAAVCKMVKRWGLKSMTELLDYVHTKYPNYCLPPAHITIEQLIDLDNYWSKK